VVAADTREPIRKARVDLIATIGDRRDPVYADNDGRFQFAGVAPGRYTLSAWKSGYAIATYGARSFWEPAAVITLDAGHSADGFEIALAKGAAISGRVVDDAGEPLSDMQVSVGRAAPVNGRVVFQAFGLPRGTDDRGEYRIGGLPPGNYVVSVFGRAAPAVASAGGDTFARMRGTFYPQTPFVTQARPVTVRSGEDIGSIDVTFTAESLVAPVISGRVVDPRGGAVQAMVMAASTGEGVADAVRGQVAAVQESGEFSMRVVPGEYTLTAQTDDQIARTRVTVDRSDVGVDLVLTPGARVAGRVIFDGSSRRPDGLEVVAVPPEQVGGPEPPRINYQPARIRPDGSFRLTRLLGTLELRVVPDTRGWRPKSITAAGRSLLDVPVDFTGGEDLRDVVIVMTDRTAAVTGSVSSGSQTPLPASLSVLVFPDNALQARRARWLRPDQLGRFVVTDLSPGDYLVAAAADVDDLQWQNAAYLNRFRSAATRVVIGDGETKSITVEYAGPQ
jgi:Carboxypeptidase regulatory-like domain